jgi:hypothetical protein
MVHWQISSKKAVQTRGEVLRTQWSGACPNPYKRKKGFISMATSNTKAFQTTLTESKLVFLAKSYLSTHNNDYFC